MSQNAIEMILSKHLAGYLAIPVFLVNPLGELVFYNEGAERLLGLRFNETGPMPAADWTSAFVPRDADGALIPAAELPLVIAFTEGRPASSRFWIDGLDGVTRVLQVTAIPLMRQARECVGAMAMFWELDEG